MCRQETALDMIKTQPKKGGLSQAHIKLVESQIADFKTMDNRMRAVEEKVEGLDKKMDSLDNKINDITDKLLSIETAVHKSASVWETFKELVSNKVVLFVLLLALSVAVGIPLSDLVGAFVKIGG